MAAYKEIVTKAIIGKGKKYFKNSYSLTPEEKPSTILGCWIINHQYKGYQSNGKIVIEGSYDVNIWYSYDNNSKTSVVTKREEYSESVSVRRRNDEIDTEDTSIIVRSLKQPSCNGVEIKDNDIYFTVEKELGIEIIGETKMKISVEDDEEPWEVIEDEVSDDTLKEIDDQVEEKFISEE